MFDKQNEFNDFIEYLNTKVKHAVDNAVESEHIFVKNNKTFFHATPISFVDGIKNNGFTLNSYGAVFFSKSFISSQNYAKCKQKDGEGIAIFAVDLSYLSDEDYNSYYDHSAKELRSREIIPADKIFGLHNL